MYEFMCLFSSRYTEYRLLFYYDAIFHEATNKTRGTTSFVIDMSIHFWSSLRKKRVWLQIMNECFASYRAVQLLIPGFVGLHAGSVEKGMAFFV